MPQSDIPWLDLFVYRSIAERFKYQAVQPDYIFEKLNQRVFRIPKTLFYKIISDFERFGLLKRVNHKSIIILPNKEIKRLDQLSSSPLW